MRARFSCEMPMPLSATAMRNVLSSAGAIEMAICCKAVEAQVAPPTINLDNPDPEADLNFVAHTPQERKIDVFANNSFGFGGHNAIIVGKRFTG